MSQIIDARSDTVTRPTAAMLEAMLATEVGDDVYGEDDETVNALQRTAAWTTPTARFDLASQRLR